MSDYVQSANHLQSGYRSDYSTCHTACNQRTEKVCVRPEQKGELWGVLKIWVQRGGGNPPPPMVVSRSIHPFGGGGWFCRPQTSSFRALPLFGHPTLIWGWQCGVLVTLGLQVPSFTAQNRASSLHRTIRILSNAPPISQQIA